MDALGDIIVRMETRDNREPGDYADEAGYLICRKCHTPKQKDIDWPAAGEGKTIRVSALCQCGEEASRRKQEAEEQRTFQERVNRLRNDGLTDPEYLNWTFKHDDRRQPDISDACHRYVEEWAQMKADNVGLLFFGNVGTGKSFYACCIANALLERCITVLVTNFPRILNKIQSAGWGENRNEFFDRLQRYELVVIDDLGVERTTDYGMEQVYSVIDTRYRSGKPLIVTTNLSPAEIKTPGNIAYERIYDRIMQNSIPVKMSGASRRIEIGAAKREKYQSLLGFGERRKSEE